MFTTSVFHTFISIKYIHLDQRKQKKILLDQIQESLKEGPFQSYSLLVSAGDTERGGAASQYSGSELGI